MSARAMRLYGRGRGLWWALLGGGLPVLVLCSVLPRSAPLLITDSDQRIRLPAVIALVVVVLLGPSFARGISEAEWIFCRQLQAFRIAHLATAIAMVVAVAAAVGSTPGSHAINTEVLVNGFGLLGVMLLTVALTPMPPWIANLMIVGTTYVIGSDPGTGRPYWWAWLLWTDHQALKVGIDLAILGAGSLLFVLRMGRVSSTAD